ncbi:MAG: ATP-binding cassette domain-containing protein [Candidatus Choladocola sp.]|nr:ATP-binding cassette domain-containing protein [Candidatus Choladocola sp.]
MSLSVHIRKKAGNFSLSVDLEHPSGMMGILGASGCGKSMTLRCIAGIEKPDEGQIVLNGRVLFDSSRKINLRPQDRGVGYLFQSYALFPNMTGIQNVMCGLHCEKNRQKRRKKAGEIMTMMGIGDCGQKYPYQMSGGQQQRTALARILVNRPELLLLDEPFSALDAYLREQMQTQIRDILEQFGRDVILVSHNRDEVYYLCNHLAVMKNGSIRRQGNTKEVFADPANRTSAVLTGCKNMAAAKKAGAYEAEIPDWGIRLRTKQKVGDRLCAVGIRAHYFDPSAEENRFPVKYTAKREDPFETRILFRYENQKNSTPDLWWKIPKRQDREQLPGQLGINPEHVLLLYPEDIE